jgi:hypothetical protein
MIDDEIVNKDFQAVVPGDDCTWKLGVIGGVAAVWRGLDLYHQNSVS